MELEALQETAADIKAQGASLVVISPQLEKYSKSMVKKHNLTFPLLRDEDNQLAAQFGLAFTLPNDLAGLLPDIRTVFDALRAYESDAPVDLAALERQSANSRQLPGFIALARSKADVRRFDEQLRAPAGMQDR